MIGISVRVQGLDAALAALDRQSGKALLARTKLGLKQGSLVFAKAMRREAPVRTGALRHSVTARADRNGSVSVGPRLWRRHFTIRGTRRGVRPNPFVDRAVDANMSAAEHRVADVILRGRR